MRRVRSPNLFVPFTDMLLAVLAVVIQLVAVTKVQPGTKLAAEYIITCEWDNHVDADVDLWGELPDEQPVFYNNRQIAPLMLDQDSKGYTDNRVTDKTTKEVTWLPAKEMMTMRGIVPGNYAFGVQMYHYYGATQEPYNLKVHLEIIKIQPSAKVIFSKDVTLNREKQSINVVAFDVDAGGKYAFTDVPLKPIPDLYVVSGGAIAGHPSTVTYTPGGAYPGGSVP